MLAQAVCQMAKSDKLRQHALQEEVARQTAKAAAAEQARAQLEAKLKQLEGKLQEVCGPASQPARPSVFALGVLQSLSPVTITLMGIVAMMQEPASAEEARAFQVSLNISAVRID